jgi:hypothetical protein
MGGAIVVSATFTHLGSAILEPQNEVIFERLKATADISERALDGLAGFEVHHDQAGCVDLVQ